MIDIVNLQRKVTLDIQVFQSFAKTLASTSGSESNFAVAFVSDRRMKKLNDFFRGKNSTTDVLSFPYEPDEFPSVQSARFSVSSSEKEQAEARTLNEGRFLGDIVISVEQAERQAKENGLTLENEIKQLILHGLLHLSGYDHETDRGEMNERELELRDELGI